MNRETEIILEQLLRQHGLELVRKHLEALIPKSKWAQWQTLDSSITNTHNRMQREQQTI